MMMKLLLLPIFCCIAVFSYAQNCIPNTSSLQFNSSYVDLNTSGILNLTDSITIEAWIYSTAWGFSSAQNTIVCKHGWSAGEEGYVLRAGGTGELSFNIACDSAGINVGWREVESSTGVLQLNTWHHVAGTFDGMELKIYVDGSLVGTTGFNTSVKIQSSPDYDLNIGRLADEVQPETRYWNGNIDEVRIWHRVVTPQDLMMNMNQHTDTTGVTDLIAYWRFNENSGTTVTDMGSGNTTGIIVGASWSSNVPFNDGPPVPVISQAAPYLFSSAPSGNQWYVDGNLIPGAINTGYQPTQNGSYTVTVTDSNGCSATSAAFLITTLGIERVETMRLLTNSGDINGILQFELTETILSNSELRIFDNTGKLVMNLKKGKVSKEVPINVLATGAYLISLQTPTRYFTEKIIVQ